MNSPSNPKREAEAKEENRLLKGLFKSSRKEMWEFIKVYSPFIHKVAREINPHDSTWSFEDLVNEAFLHLFDDNHKRLRSFQFKSRLSTYIFVVVRRHLLSKINHRKMHPEDGVELDQLAGKLAPELDWASTSKSNQEEQYIQFESGDERQKAFREAYEQLKPEEQLHLKYVLDGYSSEEIVDLLNYRDRNQLDKSKFRIIQKIKKHIQQPQVEKKHA